MAEITIDEQWKPIRGYERLYEVSNYGRIKSLNYHGRGVVRILRLTAKPNCYIKVGLRKGKKTKTYRIHRLVAEAFLLPPRPEQTQIDHLNGQKQDNRASNLRYSSPKANSNNPNTKQNLKRRYHKKGEFERRSQGQFRRWRRSRQMSQSTTYIASTFSMSQQMSL